MEHEDVTRTIIGCVFKLKSVQRLNKAHEIQLVNYLVATGISVGLLVNFGEDKAEVKRKARQLTNCRRKG